MPNKDQSHLYAGVPESWNNYKPIRVLKLPTSPMITYLGREFLDVREPSLATIRGTCIEWLARTIVLWK